MSILESLAERRILQAQREGAFERLRGEGQPLRLEADEHVPPEWRAAFRMLQQAWLAPAAAMRRTSQTSTAGSTAST